MKRRGQDNIIAFIEGYICAIISERKAIANVSEEDLVMQSILLRSMLSFKSSILISLMRKESAEEGL